MQPRTIAVIGGTGKEGSGLALRWAHAGNQVLIGSRSAERARDTAAEINARLSTERTHGMDNAAAAHGGEIVALAVPYAAQLETLGGIQPALTGKILIDVTVPLVPPQVGRAQLPEGGSAVLAAQNMLGAGEAISSVPWFWSDQYDLTLQIAGLAQGSTQQVRRDLGDGAFILFHLAPDGRLLAASGIGPGNAVAKDIRLAEMLIGKEATPDVNDLA